MKELKQITVIGLGLLGGSVALAILRRLSGVKVVGYTHRAATRRKARQLAVANKIVNNLSDSVLEADLVILATPVCTFKETFSTIANDLPDDCIITDIGSTKVLPHRWAAAILPKTVHYVGSHPIAGSEQRGLEFARADLFDGAKCILTTTKATNQQALKTLEKFWMDLGCSVDLMRPAEHDRILANISHVPHVLAAALVNATKKSELKLAGPGFTDTSRVASGPANVWADVLVTNANNLSRGIDKIIAELLKLKKALSKQDRQQIEILLEAARAKRAEIINYKVRKKRLIL